VKEGKKGRGEKKRKRNKEVKMDKSRVHPSTSKALSRRERTMRPKKKKTARQQVARVVDNAVVQWGILVLVVLDAALFAIEYDDNIVIAFGGGDKDQGVLNINTVSLVIVCVFMVEMPFKIFAYRTKFFKDALNVIDFLIVFLSFGGSLITYLVQADPAVGAMLSDAGNAIVLLRLFRLLRVLRFLSKIHQHARGNQKKKLSFDVPAERVVHLLRRLRNREEAIAELLSSEGKDPNMHGDEDRVNELKFITRIILTRQLYKPSLEQIEGLEDDDNSEIQRFIMNEYAGAGADSNNNNSSGADAAKKRMSLSNGDGRNSRGRGISGSGEKRGGGIEKRRASVMLLGLTDVSDGGETDGEMGNNRDEAPESMKFMGEESIMERLNSTDFNSFELASITQQPVYFVSTACILKCGLHRKLNIDINKLRSFLKELETLMNEKNPYSCGVKAADAVQFSYFLLRNGLEEKLTDVAALALLVGSSVMYAKHSGYVNRYHIDTQSPTAITYNDRAVNQNNALTAAFGVLWKAENNFLDTFEKGVAKQFRDIVIAAVLNSDFVSFGETLGQFKGKVEAAQLGEGGAVAFDKGNVEDMKALVRMALHSANICTTVRNESTCVQWSRLRMDERYKQGDMEKADPKRLDGYITPFCDRDVPGVVEKLHTAEIESVTMPTFKAMVSFLPSLSPCMTALERNASIFKKMVDGDKATIAFFHSVRAPSMVEDPSSISKEVLNS